ncbi:hypothetical protein B0H16DRAFT_1459430 [Mycena metata]|uniref:Uncharacterized protein n=1 Tax=Mycena metata TaxID=1033252 RepID=A0AAD7IZ01_9AGAR|nr:hypothetical protein B0H16DRAFT_1459430 [Mycena metata]
MDGNFLFFRLGGNFEGESVVHRTHPAFASRIEDSTHAQRNRGVDQISDGPIQTMDKSLAEVRIRQRHRGIDVVSPGSVGVEVEADTELEGTYTRAVTRSRGCGRRCGVKGVPLIHFAIQVLGPKGGDVDPEEMPGSGQSKSGGTFVREPNSSSTTDWVQADSQEAGEVFQGPMGTDPARTSKFALTQERWMFPETTTITTLVPVHLDLGAQALAFHIQAQNNSESKNILSIRRGCGFCLEPPTK